MNDKKLRDWAIGHMKKHGAEVSDTGKTAQEVTVDIIQDLLASAKSQPAIPGLDIPISFTKNNEGRFRRGAARHAVYILFKDVMGMSPRDAIDELLRIILAIGLPGNELKDLMDPTDNDK